MNKRREFLLASGAVVTTLAAPVLAEAATTTQDRKLFKITVNYIPGLVSTGNVLTSGGGDKKEKEVVVTVESDTLDHAHYAITWNADGGFMKIDGKNEIVAIAMASVTRYSVTTA